MTMRIGIINLGNRTGDMLKIEGDVGVIEEDYMLARGRMKVVMASKATLEFTAESRVSDAHTDKYVGQPQVFIADEPKQGIYLKGDDGE